MFDITRLKPLTTLPHTEPVVTPAALSYNDTQGQSADFLAPLPTTLNSVGIHKVHPNGASATHDGA
jgi:hypothetical protein